MYNGDIYNFGGGSGSLKDYGTLQDADIIELKNLSYYQYHNESRSDLYFSFDSDEVLTSIVDVKTDVNATVSVYHNDNGILTPLNYLGSNSISSGDYRLTVCGDTFSIEPVTLVNGEYANIGGDLVECVKIVDQIWTMDYNKVIGALNPGDRWYLNSATRTNGTINLYNYKAIQEIENTLDDGWRLPSGADFYKLFQNVGGTGANYKFGVGNQLKKIGSWNTDSGITNSSNFSSEPTGRIINGNNLIETENAFYWTTDPDGDAYMYTIVLLDSNNNAELTNDDVYYDFVKVRFVKDL